MRPESGLLRKRLGVKRLANVVALSLITAVWTSSGRSEPATHNAELFPGPGASALTLRLELPLRDVLRGRSKARDDEEPVTHGAKLEVGDQQLELTVSRRGKSRQTHCSFPPLWLDFKKKTTAHSPFAGQNKLKLVTHCKNAYEKRGFLAAEMLAYELLNLFTERSFRTRAVQMVYVDSSSDEERTHWGFLIEHKKQLAARLEGSASKLNTVARSDLIADYSALVAVHQYLIGNTDFSFTHGPPDDNCCHNVVPITLSEKEPPNVLPVPYDFDASGLVNPPYAAPVASLSISKVTQRLYRGYCDHNDQALTFVAEIVQQKQRVMQHIQAFDTLPNLPVQRITRFVDKFYKVAESADRTQSRLVAKCR
ncbi:MAG: hypothetical protein AAF993_07855 [Pseudomonadota bacterium]